MNRKAKTHNSSKKINKNIAPWLIASSLTATLIYIGFVVAYRAIDQFEPSSLMDVIVGYGYLSIPLIVPAVLIGLGVFGSLFSQRDKALILNVISVLLILLYVAGIWLVLSFVLYIAGDRLAPVSIDLI